MSDTFTVGANSKINVGFPARYLYIDDISVANAELTLKAKGERFDVNHIIRKGTEINDLPEVINDWEIENKTGVAITVTITAGLFYYSENKIVGDFNAETTRINHVASNTVFAGKECLLLTSGVGNYASQQLFNPLASGVTVELLSVTGVTGDTNVGIGFHNVQFATAPVGLNIISLSQTGAANALINNERNNTPSVGYANTNLIDETKANNGFFEFKQVDEAKILLGPGQGIAVTNLSTTNTVLAANWKWREYSNA